VLREYERAVDGDVEHTAIALDELRLHAQLTQQPGPQTGGPWQVVSPAAIRNGDPHGVFSHCTRSLLPYWARDGDELVAVERGLANRHADELITGGPTQ